MATVKDFYNYLNKIAPFETQENWDNSGILVGNPNETVKKAIVVLDITTDAVSKAVELGANLIVSHHPVIFKGLKAFVKGSVPYELAVNNINAICCHTPLDIAQGGTNDTLADILGFNAVTGENPILRYAEIPETNADKLAQHIAAALKSKLRYIDGKKNIKRIAICTGSGCSLISEAGEIDAFITGDAGYHDFLDAAESGITLIAAGHFETEILIAKVLESKLSKAFPEIETTDIGQENPVNYI